MLVNSHAPVSIIAKIRIESSVVVKQMFELMRNAGQSSYMENSVRSSWKLYSLVLFVGYIRFLLIYIGCKIVRSKIFVNEV